MEPTSQQTDHLSRYLQGRPLAAWRDEFDTRGFVIFEKVLAPDHVARIRAALAPYLESGKKGATISRVCGPIASTRCSPNRLSSPSW
jgi:hypothetical protein